MLSKWGILWKQPIFLRFWFGETISLVGTQITNIALPLTAVTLLEASPIEMGILGLVTFLPFLLVSLFVGVWIDRVQPRPIMIGCDIGLFFLISSIPMAQFFQVLSIYYLYGIGFLSGVLSVCFAIAYQAVLPTIVTSANLTEANSKLETTNSLAGIIGPGMGGWLIQLLSAPLALIFDAFSFLVSALMLSTLNTNERRFSSAAPPSTSTGFWNEMREGIQFVLTDKLLRSIVKCTATMNFFGSLMGSAFTIYTVRELRLTPAVLGLVLATGSIGALLGAVTCQTVTRSLGLGNTMALAAFLAGLSNLGIPLAGCVLPLLTVPCLVIGYFIHNCTMLFYDINQISLRQSMAPAYIQGRLNATVRFIVCGVLPLGALTGGLLSELVSLQATLWLGAASSTTAFIWVFFSPVRSLSERVRWPL